MAVLPCFGTIQRQIDTKILVVEGRKARVFTGSTRLIRGDRVPTPTRRVGRRTHVGCNSNGVIPFRMAYRVSSATERN